LTKESRFLVTTAIEETWGDNRPILFLGEWCRVYTRKDKWSKINAIVMSRRWDNRELFISDIEYLNALYEKILVDLASILNKTHGKQYSLKYWRILIGPWTSVFIQLIFDRWMSIMQAYDSYHITGTTIVKYDKDNMIPLDMHNFFALKSRDEWNHHIYAEIIGYLGKSQCNYLDVKLNTNIQLQTSAKRSIKNRILCVVGKLFGYFIKSDDIFFKVTSLKKLDEIILSFKLFQLPQYWQEINSPKVECDSNQRKWQMSLVSSNKFETFLFHMLPRQIPKIFIEGYSLLLKEVEYLPWPNRPKLIFTSISLWDDSMAMAYAAGNMEKGTPIVIMQHGGNYGTARFEFTEMHEISISNKFLTWGQADKSNPKIIPVGIPKVRKKISGPFNGKNTLLLVCWTDHRYARGRGSSDNNINMLGHINIVFQLAGLLPEKIKNKCLVRLHRHEFGWFLPNRWREKFPSINLDLGQSKIEKLIINSRLSIFTYNSTGILEALALGVPSLLYCDLALTPLRETAVPYFEDLKKVGIFHDDPISAAQHISAVWDDVDLWWGSRDVKNVVEKFTKQYCNQPTDFLEAFELIIRNTAKDHK